MHAYRFSKSSVVNTMSCWFLLASAIVQYQRKEFVKLNLDYSSIFTLKEENKTLE